MPIIKLLKASIIQTLLSDLRIRFVDQEVGITLGFFFWFDGKKKTRAGWLTD